jgi:hypothetical protein
MTVRSGTTSELNFGAERAETVATVGRTAAAARADQKCQCPMLRTEEI